MTSNASAFLVLPLFVCRKPLFIVQRNSSHAVHLVLLHFERNCQNRIKLIAMAKRRPRLSVWKAKSKPSRSVYHVAMSRAMLVWPSYLSHGFLASPVAPVRLCGRLLVRESCWGFSPWPGHFNCSLSHKG